MTVTVGLLCVIFPPSVKTCEQWFTPEDIITILLSVYLM